MGHLELALARKVVVVYGNVEMSWSDFADSIAIFIKSLEHIDPVLDEMIQEKAQSIKEIQHIDAVHNLGANVLVSFINNLFRRDENGDVHYRMMNLEDLVSSLWAFGSKDSRDTIYAVLALASDTHNLPPDADEDEDYSSPSSKLRPAYHRCLLDVYTDFIECCIDQSQSLDILLRHWAPAPDRTNYRDNCEPLPSWIPLIQKSPYGTAAQRKRGRSNGDGYVGSSCNGHVTMVGGNMCTVLGVYCYAVYCDLLVQLAELA
ncbi:hypothetical protein VTL71DRAFT_12434 [Oculimacula yallundae]|uniref:Uncharacterized protein n=1 Tax=Oculimacula yallundae TaxID=86028 RepID=A0ABR4CML5_9HELO